jgi:hypothetical protein
MFRATSNRVLLAGVLLVAVASGVCVAVTVNINPHKIVLNAEGKADDVQANIPMVLPSARIVDFAVTLSFNGTVVAHAESARYCVIDDMLIIGFDRTDLQNNPDVQDMANSTVTAEVDGYVTVENSVGDETTRYFNGTDMVEIVKPGRK